MPDGQVVLLEYLIKEIVERENIRSNSVDISVNQQVLGGLAYNALYSDFSMKMPENFVKKEIANTLVILKDESLVKTDLTVGELWNSILSMNFIRESARHYIVDNQK